MPNHHARSTYGVVAIASRVPPMCASGDEYSRANTIMTMFWNNFQNSETAFVMRDVIAVELTKERRGNDGLIAELNRVRHELGMLKHRAKQAELDAGKAEDARDAARAEGFAAGVEAAAREIETERLFNNPSPGSILHKLLTDAAAAIRALKTKD